MRLAHPAPIKRRGLAKAKPANPAPRLGHSGTMPPEHQHISSSLSGHFGSARGWFPHFDALDSESRRCPDISSNQQTSHHQLAPDRCCSVKGVEARKQDCRRVDPVDRDVDTVIPTASTYLYKSMLMVQLYHRRNSQEGLAFCYIGTQLPTTYYCIW